MCEQLNGVDGLCRNLQYLEFRNKASNVTERTSTSGSNLPRTNFERTGDDKILNEKIEWLIKNGDVDELGKIILGLGGVDYLTQNLSRPALVIAADYGQNDVIRYLSGKHLSVNVLDRYGVSPLLAAIWEGHAKTVQVLLNHGADLHAFKSPAGQTYLNEAADDKVIIQIIQQYL